MWLSGCYSGAPGAEADDAPPEGADDSGDAGPADDADGGDDGDDDVDPPPAMKGSPGVRLLAPRELRNAIIDLVGVAVPLAEIPEQQVTEGHGAIAAAQGVGLTDLERYYALAESVAAQAVSTADTDCSFDDADCGAAYAISVMRRAYRRPLSAAEETDLLAVLDEAAAGDGPRQRLETALTIVLTSAPFLYRDERGDSSAPVDGRPHAYWLDDHAIATRLSFLVWQSIPDELLREAAEAGELTDPELRVAQLQRMLADPRARVGQLGFVDDWMGRPGNATAASKDPEVLQGTSPDLSARIEASLDATIAAELFDGSGSWASLLGVDRYWLDAEVGALLEVDAGPDIAAVDLHPEVRRGLLLHPAVVASHTKESGASPFSLGTFVYEHVLCETIPAPGEIPPFSPDTTGAETLREQLEALTEPAECQGCHARIGPPGFAFLAFDPLGRHRSEDGNGVPWDTSGSIPVGSETVDFTSASDLARQLAEHDAVSRCLARRAFRWTYGHFEGDGDEDVVQALEDTATETGASMHALLESIVRSDAFAQVQRGQ